MDPIEILLKRAAESPDDIAYYFQNDQWSYSRLIGEVDAAASFLIRKGVQKGDRVVLHLPNSPELIAGLLGCFRIGAIALPLNNRFRAREVSVVLARARPHYYIGSLSFEFEIGKISTAILPLERRLFLKCLGEACDWPPTPALGHTAFVSSSDRNAPALLLPTSGTTGDPKIVVHTASTLSAIITRYEGLGLLPDDVMLNASPMVHAGGLFNLLASLARPGPMVMIGSFEPDKVLEALQTHRCTWFKGLPFMFEQLIAAQVDHPRNTSSLRFAISSGDVCPKRTQREFESVFGCRMFSAWASTEAATSLSISDVERSAFEIPDASCVTLENGTASQTPGDEGELVVSGPNVSPGYWLVSGKILENTDGRFHTGDLMRRLPSGRLEFVGRKKNLIIRGGSNISPAEVEAALKLSPIIKDAAVFGIPDTVLGEKVGALIELSTAGEGTLEEALACTRANLSEYKVPEIYSTVSALPRGANGKIDRAALLPLFQSGLADFASVN
ncbi:class I adenylate-forming enzyme family protein [Rhizobium sp. 2MFCol3.1]|uniref:class I adenylate-forming enzyme family protein n=1 Tax=Rhizobium sp. 2MFCol3.1 TaxID=1246459 RepID=UPI0003767968|nr:class I adenylate-forming enzyme family protein [Rhizobium sp. 2MFCol3.1]